MTRPRRYLLRMLLFLLVVAVAAGLLYRPLSHAFMASAPINGLILGVLLLGIIYSFRQVFRLIPEVNWLESYRSDREVLSHTPEPHLVAPMARMLGERRGRLSLSTMAMRSLLDGIGSRLDESRELARYTIGLLIFLGLLGTFWGLLQTIGSVGDVIGGLSVEGGDVSGVFANLKKGLEAPLAGMGTAFSSSLFGLGGSLVLGFLDLQAGQAQNRFYNDLEEWLSGLTRLSSGALPGDGEQRRPRLCRGSARTDRREPGNAATNHRPRRGKPQRDTGPPVRPRREDRRAHGSDANRPEPDAPPCRKPDRDQAHPRPACRDHGPERRLRS